MAVNAALYVHRHCMTAVGPWFKLRLGGRHRRNFLLFDVHAQRFTGPDGPFDGFGAGFVLVVRLRGRLLVRFGRNWGRAYS